MNSSIEKAILNSASIVDIKKLINSGEDVNVFQRGKVNGNLIYEHILKRIKDNSINSPYGTSLGKSEEYLKLREKKLKDDLELVRFLIESELKPNIKNINGDTILHRLIRLINMKSDSASASIKNKKHCFDLELMGIIDLVISKDKSILYIENDLKQEPFNTFVFRYAKKNLSTMLNERCSFMEAYIDIFIKHGYKIDFNAISKKINRVNGNFSFSKNNNEFILSMINDRVDLFKINDIISNSEQVHEKRVIKL